MNLGISGHRGDLSILKTARALAALRGGEELAAADLRDAIRLALPHRIPRAGVSASRAYHVERLLSWAFPGEAVEEEERGPVVPLPETAHGLKRGGVVWRIPARSTEQQEREAIERARAMRHRYEAAEAATGRKGPPTCGDPDCDYCQGYVQETVVTPSDPYEVRKIVAPKGRRLSDAVGKRSKARTKSSRGRYVRSVPWEKGRDIAIDATLFAAAAIGSSCASRRTSGRPIAPVACSTLSMKRARRVPFSDTSAAAPSFSSMSGRIWPHVSVHGWMLVTSRRRNGVGGFMAGW